MNPPSNEQGELRLPTPVSDMPPAFNGQAAAPNVVPTITPERAPAGAESGALNPVAGMPAALPPAMPQLPTTPPPATNDDVSSTTLTDVPNTADDVDLIEKEWVNKAKQIVERTRDDPHEQSQELTVIKADYLKKRYNKTIKLSE